MAPVVEIRTNGYCHDRVAVRFTPTTPYRLAVRSFVVPAKQSNRSSTRTFVKPADSNTPTSSASSRAPAIQPVQRSMSRSALSGRTSPMTMSANLRATAWLQDSRDLADGRGLVWHQVEHAIRDHDVDGRVVEREARRIAITNVDVREAAAVAPAIARSRIAAVMSTPIARPCGPIRLAARSKSVPAPHPMSSTTALPSIGAIACGFPTPANDAVTATGSCTSSIVVISEPRGCVGGTAVKMKLRVRRGRDPTVHRLNLVPERCDVEFHRARQGHRSPPLTSNVTHARNITRSCQRLRRWSPCRRVRSGLSRRGCRAGASPCSIGNPAARHSGNPSTNRRARRRLFLSSSTARSA